MNTPVKTNTYNNTNTIPVISVSPPAVEIISPSGSSYSTATGSLDITARVRNVRGKQDIQVVLNEKNIPFDFNPVYGNVSSGLTLTEGKNILVITGSNEAGSTRDDLIINWNKPVPVALPFIKFIDPASPVTVEKNIFSISVRTRNVKAWQDVTVTVNGTTTSNFSFSPEGMVTTNIPLNEGENKVEVRGKNDSGSASDLTTITYTKSVKDVPPPCPPPVLKMMAPAQNELLTDNPSCTIRTGVSNERTGDQISVTLNDRIITNFNFTGNVLNFPASLNEGINSCVIVAASNCGTQKLTYSITFKPAEVVVE